MSIGEQPLDDNYKPISAWDPVNHAPAVPDIANGALDNGVRHGPASLSLSQPLTASTGTKSNVASSTSSVTILAANPSRKGALIYNDSTAVLYLDLSGGPASSSSYSVQVGAQGYFELPPQPIYIGAIAGIWASANGNARVTEFS